MGKLDNKVCIVTGAGGGLGKQTAIRFAEEGAIVCLNDIFQENADITAEECRKRGAEVLAMECDVSDFDQCKRFVDAVAEKYGRVDALCNNACNISAPMPFEDLTTEDLDMSIKSGLYGTWWMMQLCFPLMKEHGGAILNYRSQAGVEGQEGFANYSATKEAIGGLTRTVAREWGKYNIRCNCLCPNVATDRFLEGLKYCDEQLAADMVRWKTNNVMGRMGYAYEDGTPAIVFLVSDDARWITGQTIHVEGGTTIVSKG
ncbi:MAG: SDR family oxidoreductase [Coriobacteriaceae bacterium]|nr:SDR family oxidoreductase [Coriobacteriaceae bacterium]